jgi:hypothetical protein
MGSEVGLLCRVVNASLLKPTGGGQEARRNAPTDHSRQTCEVAETLRATPPHPSEALRVPLHSAPRRGRPHGLSPNPTD